jgi:hypothetical protein
MGVRNDCGVGVRRSFFFMGSLIAHNVGEIEGVRNSIDLFCHKNVLTWKDMCDEEKQEVKLN